MNWQSSSKPLFIGPIAGLVFGCVDLVLTWRNPLEDDTPLVLFRFYGPMFMVWAVVAFNAARTTGRLRQGIAAGMVVACATFAVFVVLNFLRVNLFLNELTDRADWQSMVMRFRASGTDSLRLFVNLDYLKGTPFKIAAATTFGAAFGTLGGALGWLMRARTDSQAA